ncbi:MAG TPA: ATP-binding protein, partial [Thermomicrobiales bacterium]|nr:ATP-binding protein [Thermomicrobiales bacterium]
MTSTPQPAIRPRERDAILQSLRAGVVPRIGQQHIQVGRANEVRALLSDIARIRDGGSGFRFVIGEYGSGKTFFMNLVRSIALQQKLVTVHADLSPERRLYATGGQARSLYAELMRNISTRAMPDGGAMASIVERFISQALAAARANGTSPEDEIRAGLAHLSQLTGGYDFAEVIARYWDGHDRGNEQIKNDAVRWLRAEFTTRTDARNALGVRTIIDDSTVYDHLKLMARFVRLAGFEGFFVFLDEMVNLYKLTNTQARNANYEQLLRIVNDCTQGVASGLGFLFGGTPDFLMDPRRGLYSYQALQSRLAENSFARDGLIDYSGPVIRLANLTPEDFYVLLGKLRNVQAGGNPDSWLIPDEGLRAYMHHCATRIGDAYFRTPRTTIKGFLDLL